MNSNVNLKRTMGEVKLSSLGVITPHFNSNGHTIRYGRTTLYKMLRDRGYRWDGKYLIWVKI